jgi:predicted RNA binding protein YcfA (HicA-like mRNA interferase family)
MPKDFYRELAKILSTEGWHKIEGGKGSHEKWQFGETARIVTVPKSKSRHTANEVLKQAGLSKQF